MDVRRGTRFLVAVCLAGLLSGVLAGCASVPITGRSQLDLISDGDLNAMSFQEYEKFLKDHKLSRDAEKTAIVRRIGERIARVVERYFDKKGMADRLKDYRWEFNLIEDKQINAWCMPGGKVVVYTGILPVARDEDGLAVVMGHEISHAVAKHGAERMSQGMLAELGGAALDAALSTKSKQTRDLFMQAYGAGVQVGALLPYSRLHESEADRLGLVFMAMAGYDPRRAVDFWKGMKKATGGGGPPAFLSTHPADAKRIADIKKELPEAMKYYRAATGEPPRK
jgi:predicted Zn-dependent protease